MTRLNRADVLVALQFLAIAGIVIGPQARAWQLPGLVATLALAALVLGLVFSFAGLAALGRDLTVFVSPPDGARLRTKGPYALSRNPVYAGLLVAMAGLAVLRARPEPLIAWLVLAVVLHFKTGAEQHQLRQRFGAEYEDYAARVPKLVGIPRRAA